MAVSASLPTILYVIGYCHKPKYTYQSENTLCDFHKVGYIMEHDSYLCNMLVEMIAWGGGHDNFIDL